jgi:hypothetical protein
MTVGHTASYHSGSRSLASIPRNGSDCGSGCRTLGPTVAVLLLLGLRRRLMALPYLQAAFALFLEPPELTPMAP